jgi:hypothetical protein
MVIKVDDEHYDSRGSLEPTQVDLTVVTKTFDYFEGVFNSETQHPLLN